VLDDVYAPSSLSRHSPSGLLREVKIACIWSSAKPFSRHAASAVGQAAGTRQVRPGSRRLLTHMRNFSAQWVDLSCRFRSVLAWIAVTRIAAALKAENACPAVGFRRSSRQPVRHLGNV
jgi:hypothetical protein